MSDFVFYPIALIAALAIVAAAALPGRDRMTCGSVSGAGTNYQRIVVDGDDLCRFEAAGQSDIELNFTGDTIDFVTVSAEAGKLGDRPDRNPHFRLAADIELQFSGHEIEVIIVARPSQSGGAFAFEANYSAGIEGNSDWRKFDLQRGFSRHTFTWTVPPRTGEEQAVDYLAIRPVVPEKTRSIDIQSVTFRRLEKVEPSEAAES